MPLFSSKFSLKKTPPRKTASLSTVRRELEANQEFGIEYGDIKLHLGDQECVFENGQWIVAGNRSHKDLAKLKKQNQQLIDENNSLKMKVELLLDMLAETTAEFHQQEVELEEVRKKLQQRR